ncbi:enoyl-CoA hydratase-related protein [Bdellovibrionota bacterium FG-2]
MTYQSILVNTDHQGVLTLTLNRPEVRNAFNDAVVAELAQVFTQIKTDPNLRAVVLRGAGPSFCAGGDLNWMKKAVEFTPAQNLEDARSIAGLFQLMNECPRPVFALVQGAAIGGGVGLVSVCDAVFATEDAMFGLSEVRLGVVPACIGPFVVSKIGASQARRYFITGERFSAKKAFEIGLIHGVYPGVSEAQAALSQTLEGVLEAGPQAVSTAKKLISDLFSRDQRGSQEEVLESVAQLLAQVRAGAEAQEGFRAFLEKRKPAWVVAKNALKGTK